MVGFFFPLYGIYESEKFSADNRRADCPCYRRHGTLWLPRPADEGFQLQFEGAETIKDLLGNLGASLGYNISTSTKIRKFEVAWLYD